MLIDVGKIVSMAVVAVVRAVEFELSDGERRRSREVFVDEGLVVKGKIVFMAVVAVVRTISGGGTRRLSPGISLVFNGVPSCIGTADAVVRTISDGGTRRLSPGVFSVIIVVSGCIGTAVAVVRTVSGGGTN